MSDFGIFVENIGGYNFTFDNYVSSNFGFENPFDSVIQYVPILSQTVSILPGIEAAAYYVETEGIVQLNFQIDGRGAIAGWAPPSTVVVSYFDPIQGQAVQESFLIGGG